MKALLKLLPLFLVLQSCSNYVQVFHIKSDNVPKKNDIYIYENDTLEISYSFWSKNGRMAFSIYNKLDIPIYVDWKKASFIANSNKFNYWVEKEYISSVSNYNTYLFDPKNASKIFIPYQSNLLFYGNSSSNSTIIKEERITFIPPKSNYNRAQFKLYPYNVINLSNGGKQDTNLLKDKYIQHYILYSKYNSPLIFRNFLSYSLSEDFKIEKYIDNEFFVDSIIEFNSKQRNIIKVGNDRFYQNLNYPTIKTIKPKNVKPKYFTSGFNNALNISLIHGYGNITAKNSKLKNTSISSTIEYVAGFNLTKRFLFSGFIGVTPFKTTLFTPFGLDLHYNFFLRKVTPFLNFQFGYNPEIINENTKGLLIINPNIGLRIYNNKMKSFIIKFGMTYLEIEELDSIDIKFLYSALFTKFTFGYNF